GERTTQIRLDLRHHVLVRPAHEPFDHVRLRHHPAELREHGDVDPYRDALRVHQDAITVEDDEPKHAGHGADSTRTLKIGAIARNCLTTRPSCPIRGLSLCSIRGVSLSHPPPKRACSMRRAGILLLAVATVLAM